MPSFPVHISQPTFFKHVVDPGFADRRTSTRGTRTRMEIEMNLQRIALMVAVLAVPCSANAFWGGSNGSCGGRAVCCAPACEPSCGSHGGSFGGCLSRVFSHGCCGSHGGFFGHRHSCGCEVSCGCQSSCGCGCESSCGCEQKSCGCGSNSGCSSCGGSSEGSSCGCGGEVKSESKPEAAAPAPAPAQEEAKK